MFGFQHFSTPTYIGRVLFIMYFIECLPLKKVQTIPGISAPTQPYKVLRVILFIRYVNELVICLTKVCIKFELCKYFSKNFYFFSSFLLSRAKNRKTIIKICQLLLLPLYMSKLSKTNETTKHFNNFFTGVGNLSSSLVHPHFKRNTRCFV